MTLEHHISEYLDSSEYSTWSLIELLRYLSLHIDYTSASIDDIINNFVMLLQSRESSSACLQSARKKATKLANSVASTATQLEIKQFLKCQDIQFAEVRLMRALIYCTTTEN